MGDWVIDNAWWDLEPQINNSGHVVWKGYDGSDYEIFLYDGVSVSRVTDNAFFDGSPVINDNGQMAWQGGSDNAIFYHDGIGITEIPNSPYDNFSPGINNMGFLVWNGYQGYITATQEIFLYDGESVTRITDNVFYDQQPKINDSGYIAWNGSPGPGYDYEIFLAVPAQQSCIDNDGDGYGNPSNPACTHTELDCNDSNPAANPGAAEVCANQMDDNCNGQVDEGCRRTFVPIFHLLLD